MGEWKLSRFAWIAIGSIGSDAREKMENHYDSRKEYLPSQNSMNYSGELSREEKDNLFKEAYACIYQFNKFFYEAKQEMKPSRDYLRENRTV